VLTKRETVTLGASVRIDSSGMSRFSDRVL
jgi:hypothetical protein